MWGLAFIFTCRKQLTVWPNNYTNIESLVHKSTLTSPLFIETSVMSVHVYVCYGYWYCLYVRRGSKGGVGAPVRPPKIGGKNLSAPPPLNFKAWIRACNFGPVLVLWYFLFFNLIALTKLTHSTYNKTHIHTNFSPPF